MDIGVLGLNKKLVLRVLIKIKIVLLQWCFKGEIFGMRDFDCFRIVFGVEILMNFFFIGIKYVRKMVNQIIVVVKI